MTGHDAHVHAFSPLEHDMTNDEIEDRLNTQATEAIDSGDVEEGWYLRGMADRVANARDDDAWRDDNYGSDYRAGFRLDLPRITAIAADAGPVDSGPPSDINSKIIR